MIEALEDRRLLAASPSLLQTIEGFNVDNTLTNNGGLVMFPPDTSGAAGPRHILNVGNSTIQWFTKDGAQQVQTSLRNFFAPLYADTGISNPKAVYDQYSNRYVVAALESYQRATNQYDRSRIMVAVSDDDDPNGTWYYQSINALVNVPSNTNPGEFVPSWTDNLGLGLDQSVLYLTGDLTGIGTTAAATRNPQGNRLWIVDKGLGKGGLYENGPSAVTMWDAARIAGVDFTGNYTGTPERRHMEPAHVYGTAQAGGGTWLVMYDGMNNGVQEFVDLVWVTNPLAAQPTFKRFSINVGDIEDTAINIEFTSPQRQTTARINGGDRRIINAVWRDNSLYATTVIYPSVGQDTNQVTAHWFRFDTTNPNIVALADQGNIGGEELGFAVHTMWPTVNVDRHGNMVVGFAATGPTMYPGAYYAVRTPTDPPGTVRTAQPLAIGQDSINISGTTTTAQNPWGRYSGVALDPADGATFWVYNSYALARQQLPARWGTRWGSLRIADVVPPPPPGPVTISGVVWHDRDENRRRDPNEPGLGGWTVWVDLDGDGERDIGEPVINTDAHGAYKITVPFPTDGQLVVRQSAKPGWQQTFPVQPSLAHVLTVTGGGAIQNVNFGNSDNSGFDWGDAPAPYPTLRKDNGPRHAIIPGYGLGVDLNDGTSALVDGEPDGQPDANALGDDNNNFDDENGVVFTTGLAPGKTAIITVTVSTGSNAPGRLQGWIDFNRNGSWADPGEQVFRNLVLPAGVHTLEIDVPSSAIPGTTFARFRYGPEKDLSFVGLATAGEVEDYRVDILTDRPVAVDDRYEVEQDSRDNVLRVLDNDIPSANGAANLRLRDVDTTGASGTAVIDRNGTPNDPTDDFIRYTPARGAFAPDVFSYTIEDAISGATSTALVSITITQAGGVVPVAVDDSYLVPPPTVPPALLDVPGDPYLLNVLRNDRVGPTGAISIAPNGLDTSSTVGTANIEMVTIGGRTVQMVRYTPTTGFSGTDQFRYTILDSLGNESTATVTIQVGNQRKEDDVVRYRLVTTDMNGNPISEIGQGLQFQVMAYVQDVRNEPGYLAVPGLPPNNRGVYSGYMDLLYDAGAVAFSSVEFSTYYTEGRFYDPRVPGILDEIGGIQGNGADNNDGNPYGPNERLLYTAVFTASTLGTARFKSDPADNLPLHETALNRPPTSVDPQQIDYGATTINVVESPDLVQVRLEATRLDGTPLPNNQVAAGSQFLVKAWVDDIRTDIPANQQGVYSAYLDILYNSNLAIPVTVPIATNPLGFDITFGTLFREGQKGINRSSVGIVDEVGAFQGSTATRFGNEQLLFQIKFVAQNAAGTLVFIADPADNLPLNETSLIRPDPGVSVPPAQIRYVNSAPIIVVGGGGEGEFTNPNNRYDVNNDGFVTPMDVLALVNMLNLTGSIDLSPFVGGEGENGGKGPYFDVNGDLRVTPMDVLAVVNVLNGGSAPSGEGESFQTPQFPLVQAGREQLSNAAAWDLPILTDARVALTSDDDRDAPTDWWLPDDQNRQDLASVAAPAKASTPNAARESLFDDHWAVASDVAGGQQDSLEDLLIDLVG